MLLQECVYHINKIFDRWQQLPVEDQQAMLRECLKLNEFIFILHHEQNIDRKPTLQILFMNFLFFIIEISHCLRNLLCSKERQSDEAPPYAIEIKNLTTDINGN